MRRFLACCGPALTFLAMVALTTCALLLLGVGRAHGSEDVPASLLQGLLCVESGSHLRADGSVYYGQRADGAAGEVGPTQISRVVCRQHHFDRDRIRSDTAYAMRCTVIHIRWLRAHVPTWDDIPAAWNAGLSGRFSESAAAYARKVKNARTTY